MGNTLLIKNCRLFNDLSGNNKYDIEIDGNLITEISLSDAERDCEVLIEANGRIIAPGFIDVHIQGAGGADILDNNENAIPTISKVLAETGTTSYLGTTVVKPAEGNAHLKRAIEFVNQQMDGANLLGFHLEGPFINLKKKGGLDPQGIYAPSLKGLDEILEVTEAALSMMTIAPEIPGNKEIIKKLRQNDIVASFAHSDADYCETIEGFEAGINHVTHIFNAMRSIEHRNPGPIPAIFENDSVTVQIISDGHHLHPATVKMIQRNIGTDRCICITDGISAIGMPEGNYFYNGKEFRSKNGTARYLDGTLIGSTMSLRNIALKFRDFTMCSLEEAIRTVSEIPAKLLGVGNKKGTIATGYDADLVIFEEDFSIFATLVNGKVIYKKGTNSDENE